MKAATESSDKEKTYALPDSNIDFKEAKSDFKEDNITKNDNITKEDDFKEGDFKEKAFIAKETSSPTYCIPNLLVQLMASSLQRLHTLSELLRLPCILDHDHN